ncbi:MAG: hypothetical protein ABSH32_34065 [Bryobacteraceae bacterium]|jgi:hypothetical protein
MTEDQRRNPTASARKNACLVDTGREANLELLRRVVRMIATHTLTKLFSKKAAGAVTFLSRGRELTGEAEK